MQVVHLETWIWAISPQMTAAIDALADGAFSTLIDMGQGFMILKVENRKVGPFEEVKDQIKEALKETAQEVVKELREKTSVEFPAEVTAPTEAPAAIPLLKHQRQMLLLQKPNNHPLGELMFSFITGLLLACSGGNTTTEPLDSPVTPVSATPTTSVPGTVATWNGGTLTMTKEPSW